MGHAFSRGFSTDCGFTYQPLHLWSPQRERKGKENIYPLSIEICHCNFVCRKGWILCADANADAIAVSSCHWLLLYLVVAL